MELTEKLRELFGWWRPEAKYDTTPPNWAKADPGPYVTGKIWKITDYKSWGNHIFLFNKSDTVFTWSGHTTPRARVGDLIETLTVSGDTMRFRLEYVDYPGDPSDQWFARSSRKPYEIVKGPEDD